MHLRSVYLPSIFSISPQTATIDVQHSCGHFSLEGGGREKGGKRNGKYFIDFHLEKIFRMET